MTVFKCDGLSAGYGTMEVLHRVSLDISEGEFVAVIGPNGAGKSTLIQTLAGNIRPSAGTVSLHGNDLSAYPPRRLARLFSVIHEFADDPAPFTVKEFISLGRFPYRKIFELENDEDREAVRWAMGITDIEGLADRSVHELSSGEKQLVNIARALVQNSRTILMDEAISHLDINHGIRVMDILHRLMREGSTVVMVLHDVNRASDYATRIIGMKDGSISFNGSPFEVLTYQNIEGLFGTPCIVIANPTTGRPFVYPVPGYIRNKDHI